MNSPEVEITLIGRRKRSYTVAFKINALSRLDALHGNISATAREFGISRQCLQDWNRERERISACKELGITNICKISKLDSDSTKKQAKFPELEEKLFNWIKERRSLGIPVSHVCIKQQALNYHKDMNIEEEFSASNGWMDRFLKRHLLVKRSVTSIGQKVPENAKDLVMSYFKFLDQAVKDIESRNIGNMDENPLWFDLPRSKIYDFKGVKHAIYRLKGNEKLRYTVVLSAMCNGRKLKPMVIFKGLEYVPNRNFPKGIVVSVAEGGSMNSELLSKWRREVWGTKPNALFKPKSILIFDDATSHIKKQTIINMRQHYNTGVVVIPAGMTPFLQPADVYWNKLFKAEMKKKWLDWLKDGKAEYTKSGKRHKASYEMIVQWVKEVWESIPSELIIESFKGCGVLTNNEARNPNKLNIRLKEIMQDRKFLFNHTDDDEKTGLTDTETDDDSE